MLTIVGKGKGREEDDPPQVIVTTPSFTPRKSKLSMLTKLNSRGQDDSGGSHNLHRRTPRVEKHVRLAEPSPSRPPASSSSSIYMGSYGHSPRRSRTSLAGSIRSAEGSAPPSPRASMSHAQLEHLLLDLNLNLDTYGVEEFRDGFFDGMFFKPPKEDRQDLLNFAEYSLPAALRKQHPLSPSNFLPRQWHELKGTVRRIATTRAGIKLTKSFLGFFVAYILCLVPVVADWLGRYNYIICLSAIINHPGRPVGSQLDGAFLTIAGTAAGLGWGALALYLSDLTPVAANGYGGILAAFMVLFIGTLASLRSYFIRSYQLVLCAGIAAIFTLLADTSRTVAWSKLLDYGIPWLLGQAICFVIACVVVPDAGARPLAVALHNAFAVMQDGLKLPRPNDVEMHRQLAWTFVNLSQAYRDLVLDISITRFLPSDILDLRNLLQAVARSLLSLKTETELFADFDPTNLEAQTLISADETSIGHTEHKTGGMPIFAHITLTDNGNQDSTGAVIDVDGSFGKPAVSRTMTEDQSVRLVVTKLAEPTMELLSCLRNALSGSDAVLLDMSGYRRYLGPPESVSSDLVGALTSLRKAMIKFDEEDEALMKNPLFPRNSFSSLPSVVELFLFANPIRQAATTTENLLVKVNAMQQKSRGWRFYFPRYPFFKGLQRTNAQVRHDRGGVTAGFYFQSQKQLNRMMTEMQQSTYKPSPRHGASSLENEEDYEEEEHVVMDRRSVDKKTLRYKAWLVLHRLQGFETRFALKAAMVTTLLAVPAWLEDSKQWYMTYQSWWAVIMAWVMLHPRVGGNFQDLITRSLCGVLGAVWGGFSYAAGGGNPYVMAVFAAIYMIPMMYRFTQSSHPRSGIIGCMSFAVVSLNTKILEDQHSVVDVAWTHGVAFVVGIVSAIVVNWILWPFVARHELRKALSAMIYHSAIIYRGVVAKIYYEDGEEPGKEDIARSELLEGRLREGFVRIRQLMALTRHEVRLRGPFDPLPFSALIEATESFFENLVSVRQSSLFFHPNYMSDNSAASEALLPFRRDAVAAILMNLYILAGALRGNRKVPRYLPSAAAARKRLLDRMAEVESEHAAAKGNSTPVPKKGVGRQFAEVYQFAYSQGLTQCVEQLEQLQKYTKAICGEVGFDNIDVSDYDEVRK